MILTETQQAIKDAVRTFAQERIKPDSAAFERAGGYPPGLFEEMAGLVLGFSPWELGLQMHQISVEPLLDKIGVSYKRKEKYLGAKGQYIGQPQTPQFLIV